MDNSHMSTVYGVLRKKKLHTESQAGNLNSNKRETLYELCAQPTSNTDFHHLLSSFFSDFGEIQRITSFHAKEKGQYYLVGFVSDNAAVRAANSTGCRMFGFNTVLVPVSTHLAKQCS